MAASRCALVVGVTLAVLAAPLAGEAQSGKVPRIGLLESGSLAARAPMWEAFRRAMRELGYVEGQAVVFEARGAGGGGKELPALAAELVRLEVDVIGPEPEDREGARVDDPAVGARPGGRDHRVAGRARARDRAHARCSPAQHTELPRSVSSLSLPSIAMWLAGPATAPAVGAVARGRDAASVTTERDQRLRRPGRPIPSSSSNGRFRPHR
jgi:hypothetical protein